MSSSVWCAMVSAAQHCPATNESRRGDRPDGKAAGKEYLNGSTQGITIPAVREAEDIGI
jgi:hypothetical protein